MQIPAINTPKIKATPYTEEETKALFAAWKNDPKRQTLEVFANLHNRTYRSVIAKLSKAGLYKREPYKSKLGENPRTKQQIVEDIAKIIDLHDFEEESLVKAGKSALDKILAKLNEQI